MWPQFSRNLPVMMLASEATQTLPSSWLPKLAYHQRTRSVIHTGWFISVFFLFLVPAEGVCACCTYSLAASSGLLCASLAITIPHDYVLSIKNNGQPPSTCRACLSTTPLHPLFKSFALTLPADSCPFNSHLSHMFYHHGQTIERRLLHSDLATPKPSSSTSPWTWRAASVIRTERLSCHRSFE